MLVRNGPVADRGQHRDRAKPGKEVLGAALVAEAARHGDEHPKRDGAPTRTHGRDPAGAQRITGPGVHSGQAACFRIDWPRRATTWWARIVRRGASAGRE